MESTEDEGADPSGRMSKAVKARLAAVNSIQNIYNASDGCVYIEIDLDGHPELIATNTEAFRYWLIYLFESNNPGQMLNKADISTVKDSLNALGHRHGEKVDVYLRIAEIDDTVYVDLCNDKRQVLEITAAGFKILDKAPVLFKRTDDMAELPVPVLKDEKAYQRLGKYLNVKSEEDLNMIISFILASYRPSIPKPILNLTGEAGSGKSTNSRLIRQFIDPAKKKDLLKKEIDMAELPTAANSQYLLAFDNLSGISKEGSDLLCVVSTGGAVTKRKLYSDADEIIIDLKKTVILNGIDSIAKRPDLVSRSLFIETPKLSARDKRSEGDIWKAFKDDYPYILGSLVNAVSTGLKNKGKDKTAYARMQDYGRFIADSSEALGWAKGYWKELYKQNQNDGLDQSIESDPFAAALVDKMERLKEQEVYEWSGTATELLDELATELMVTDIPYNRSWPKTNQVKGRLRRIAPLLDSKGISWGDTRSNGKNILIITVSV